MFAVLVCIKFIFEIISLIGTMFLKLEIKLTQSLLDLVRYDAVGPDLFSLTNSVSSEARFLVHVPVPLGQSYISFMSNVISWNQ